MLTERKSLQHNDAGGGTRTRKGRSPGDFKSPVFTDFTTPAYFRSYWTFDLPCPPRSPPSGNERGNKRVTPEGLAFCSSPSRSLYALSSAP